MGRDVGGRASRRPSLSLWLFLAGAVLIAGSGFRIADPGVDRGQGRAGDPTVDAGSALDPLGPAHAAGLPLAVPAAPTAVVTDPVRVRVPAIGVDAPVARLGLNSDGTLAVPARWGDVGWYESGPAPGAVGPSILVGHYDSTDGPAVFYRLRSLKVGDQIEVAPTTGPSATFTVYRSEDVAKAAFPTDRVYGPVIRPELRLITCGGAFDEGTNHYLDNHVVYAYGNPGRLRL